MVFKRCHLASTSPGIFERCWLSVANWRAPTPQLVGAATFQPQVPEQVSPLLRPRLRAQQCDATFPGAQCRRDRLVQLTLTGERPGVVSIEAIGRDHALFVEPRVMVLADRDGKKFASIQKADETDKEKHMKKFSKLCKLLSSSTNCPKVTPQ